MLILHDREKLINAILFFVQNTRFCGKIKLFKLLYFLDFEHFKATGRSVTGLNYFAWKMGPVPVSLYEEIEQPEPDMDNAMSFEQKPVGEGLMLVVRPKVSFSEKNFSKRELRILKSLAEEYKSAKAEDMIEATHLENLPWDKVYNQRGNKRGLIPYELAVRPDELDAIRRVSEDRKELLEKLR